MKVVRSKVVMAAMMALLVINGTSAALNATGTNERLIPGLGSLLPALPALPSLPTLPSLPMLPSLPALPSIGTSGVCPTYNLLTGFTKAAFHGTWWVYQQSHNLVETSWTCKKVIYSTTSNAFTYSYKHLGVQMSNDGTYTVPNPTSGAISVQLQNAHALGADSMGKVNQFVVAGVGTDYMIIRSCTFFPAVPGLLSFNIEYVYVLTRAQVPSAAVTTAIAAAATTAGIGSGVLRAVDQTNC